MGAGPVFIAGCGRSGTTYLKTIVDAHEDVFIPTESLFIADYLLHGEAMPPGVRKRLFFREPQLRSWYAGEAFDFADPAEAVRRVHEIAAAGEGASVWGQKTPRFVRWMDAFDSAFPGARWLLICRDPRAVVASMLRSVRHTYSLTAACRRWVRDNRPVIEHRGSPSPRVRVIRYEDLVRDFDEQLRGIWEFLSLPPLTREQVARRGAVREYRGSGFSVRENTVRGGLEPRGELLDTWKRRLTRDQIRRIERLCAAEMEALGYPPAGGDAGLADRPLEPLRNALGGLKDVCVFWEYLTHWPQYPAHTALRKAVIACCRAVGGARRRGGRVERSAEAS